MTKRKKDEKQTTVNSTLPNKTMNQAHYIDFFCLTPLSAIFQLYHGDQF